MNKEDEPRKPFEEPASSSTGPRLWVVLARAYGSLAAYVETCIADEGLCLSDFMVLEVLLHKGPMTISAIGEKVLLANTSMTAAIDRLEKLGYANRKSCDSDRRIRIVDLTEAGRKFISEMYERHARDLASVFSVLNGHEQEQIRSSLKRLGLAAKAAADNRMSKPSIISDLSTETTAGRTGRKGKQS